MSTWNSSYVLGYDNISGWGERYFFTLYNQFGDNDSYLSKCIEAIIFGFIFVVSLISNIVIGACVFLYPDMQTVTNYFVLNLVAADLLFVLSIPGVAYSRIISAWTLGNIVCKMIPYTELVSGIVLIWTLTLISMDRYKCIVKPPYRSTLTRRLAIIYSGMTWLLTLVIFIPVLIWFREQSTYEGKLICTMVFPQSEILNYSLFFLIPLILIACLLPMIVLVYNYKEIFSKIVSMKSNWGTSCVDASISNPHPRRQSEVSLSDIFAPWPRRFSSSQFSGSVRHGSLSQQEEIRFNKHIKVVRVLFFNGVLVLVMWLPITVIMLLMFIDGRRSIEDNNFFLTSHHFIISLIIAMLNTVVNPLLYGLLSDNFKHCLLKMFCREHSEEAEEVNIIRDSSTMPRTPSSARRNSSYNHARIQSFINNAVDQYQNEDV